MESSSEGATPAATSSQQTQSKVDKRRYYYLMATVIGLSAIAFAFIIMQYLQNQDMLAAYKACDPIALCKGYCSVGRVFGV